MREITPKFKIGTHVRIRNTETVFKGKEVCPLCNGKHKVPNIICRFDWEEDFIECEHCLEDGTVRTNPVKEKTILNGVYVIDKIYITIEKDSVNFRYSYTDNEHISGVKDEEDFVRCTKSGELSEGVECL